MSSRFRGLAMAAICSTTLLGACAQQVGDIDRTQPNKIEKTAFEGEWYFMQTVVDVNATAVSSFTGLMGPLERVRFDIREDFLVARRTYEDIIGSDSSNFGVAEGVDFEGGAPVAAFPIWNHFDVQRQYNPATGEVSNVIIENSFDRPWFEREWMRPDFSRNMVNTGINPMMDIQMVSNVSYNPNDQGPFTTWFVERDDDGNVTYIDIVNEYVIQPDWVDCALMVGIPNWGSECGPERIKVRSSFVRIMEESDHIARVYDDFEMLDFGFFRTHRCVMDRRYGCRDNTRVTLANIWSIWENDRDAQGNPIPYAQRTPDPIAYYSNTEMPVDLIDESFEIAEEWSVAFARAVAAAQGKTLDDVGRMFYFCLNPGSEDATVPADVLALAGTPEEQARVTAAYAASAEGYQRGVCQRPGEEKNLGDLRYSFFNWVNNHPSAPWLGYGPSGADPLTAEIIVGAANVNGQSVDTYAQYALDIARAINGDITVEDLGYGEYLADYFNDIAERNQDRLYLGYEDPSIDYQGAVRTGEQGLNALLTARPPMPVVRTLPEDITRMRVDRSRLLDTARHHLDNPRILQVAETMRTQPDVYAMRNDLQRDPLARIRGTSIEQQMITEEMRVGFGQIFEASPEGISEEELMDMVSPARWNRVGGLHERTRNRYRQNLTRTIEMAADFDPAMLGFATEIAQMSAELEAQGVTGFDLQERLWRHVRGRVYRAVQEHEVGHTIGLRHNFEASRDPLNFHPQYWALREKTFNPDCDGLGFETFTYDGMTAGDVAPNPCTGAGDDPAAEDARVMTEIRNGIVDEQTRYGGIHQYQYASIMDYDARPSTHWSGLGLYDYAAIAYGYSEMVEVFAEAPFRLKVDARFSIADGDRNGTDRTAESYDGASYTRAGGRITDMRDIDTYNVRTRSTPYNDDTEFDPISDTGFVTDNRWIDYHYSILPILFYDRDAEIDTSNIANQYHPLIDASRVDAMAMMYNRQLVPRSELEDSGLVRVPYRFCSDEYESTSNVCKIFDLGADDTEALATIKNGYENYYVMDYFRRGRAGFGLWMYPVYARTLTRYFLPAIQIYQYWVLDLFRGQNWYGEERAGFDRYAASLDAINFVGSVLTTPTVGTYRYVDEMGMYQHESDDVGFRFDPADPQYASIDPDSYMDIGVADGGRFGATRFVRNEDREVNYYSFLQFEVASHFFAKLAALEAITAGSVDVLGADTISDNSAFWLPPYTLFPDELTRLMGGVLNEDFRQVGWCITDDGTGDVRPRPIEVIRGGLEDSGDACAARGGTLLNPYRAGFGRSDFNIQLQGAIYSAAYFQAVLDKGWMDRSAVYVGNRGELPVLLEEAGVDPAANILQYEHVNGVVFAALEPADYDPTDLSGVNSFPGRDMVQRMIDLRRRYDTACVFRFLDSPDDLQLNCRIEYQDALEFACGYFYQYEEFASECDGSETDDALYACDYWSSFRTSPYETTYSLEDGTPYNCSGWDDESSDAHVELNGDLFEFFGTRNDLDNLLQTARFQVELGVVFNNF